MKQTDLFDLVFNKIKNISIPIGLILTMLVWQAIGVILLWVFGISFDKLNDILRVGYAFIFDVLFSNHKKDETSVKIINYLNALHVIELIKNGVFV